MSAPVEQINNSACPTVAGSLAGWRQGGSERARGRDEGRKLPSEEVEEVEEEEEEGGVLCSGKR